MHNKTEKTSQVVSVFDSLFCCDTVTLQNHSEHIIGCTYIVGICIIVVMATDQTFASTTEITSWGVPEILVETVYYLILMVFMTQVLLILTPLCFGNNTNSPYWHIFMGPVAVICFYNFRYDLNLDSVFQLACDNESSKTCDHNAIFTQRVITIMLWFILIFQAMVALRISLPSAISRRQHAYIYVKELLSNRRLRSESAQERYEGSRTAWKRRVHQQVGSSKDLAALDVRRSTLDQEFEEEIQTEEAAFRGSDGTHFGTDLAAYVNHLKLMGRSDRAIMGHIYRMHHAELLNLQQAPDSLHGGGGPEKPDLRMSNPSKHLPFFTSISETIFGSTILSKNPHSVLKFTSDVRVPGNIRSELQNIPIKIKVGVVFVLLVIIYTTMQAEYYLTSSWACAKEVDEMMAAMPTSAAMLYTWNPEPPLCAGRTAMEKVISVTKLLGISTTYIDALETATDDSTGSSGEMAGKGGGSKGGGGTIGGGRRLLATSKSSQSRIDAGRSMFNMFNVTSAADWAALSPAQQETQTKELELLKSQWDALYEFMSACYSSFWSALLTTDAIVVFSCGSALQGYRKLKYELRVQQIQDFNCKHEDAPPYYSTYYLSAVVVYTSVGMVYLLLLLFPLYVSFIYSEARDYIWTSMLLPYLVAYLFTYLWNSLLFRDFIYSQIVTEDSNIMYRRAFIMLDWWLQCFQVIMTLYAATVRMALLSLFAAVSLLRLDVVVMPRGIESFDTGPLSFQACHFIHERVHNPVITEFIDRLCVKDPHESLRGVENLKRFMAQRTEEDKKVRSELTDKLDAALEALKHRAAAMENAAMRENFTVGDVTALRSFHVARNRWHLAVLLMQNPSLMKYRKHRLPKKAVTPACELLEQAQEHLQHAFHAVKRSTSWPQNGAVATMGSDPDEEDGDGVAMAPVLMPV